MMRKSGCCLGNFLMLNILRSILFCLDQNGGIQDELVGDRLAPRIQDRDALQGIGLIPAYDQLVGARGRARRYG